MVKQTGTLHKGIDLTFEIEGPLDVTPDGEIRLRASKIRSAHFPVKGLLHLFGEDLSKLINLNQNRGLRLEGDTILLNPSRILPPPHIAGSVTAVQLEGDSIVETLGSKEAKPLLPPYKAPNYICDSGNSPCVTPIWKLSIHHRAMLLISACRNTIAS